MAGIDIQALTAAVFSRLKTDSAGSSVRAALGAAGTSVIHARQLSAAALAARPFVALRGGPISGSSKDMRIPLWRWWIYDDDAQGYWRINGLIPLIEAAYGPYTIALTTAKGRIEVANVGDETTDDALQLPVRSIQLAFYTRG